MEPDEPFGVVTARDAFRLNTGRDVTSGVLQLGLEAVRRQQAHIGSAPVLVATG